MAPPEVTASRCAPGRAVSMPASRSYTNRGRSSANSVDGYLPYNRSSVASNALRGSVANGAAAPDRVEPHVGVQRLQRGRRDGLLRQHVERIGGHPHGFDLAGEHALDA